MRARFINRKHEFLLSLIWVFVMITACVPKAEGRNRIETLPAEKSLVLSAEQTEEIYIEESQETEEDQTATGEIDIPTESLMEHMLEDYELYEADEVKSGEYYGEYGRAIGRPDLQSYFYTDVQDLCTEVFGDYHAPLQGLYHLLSDIGYGYVKGTFRTDIETAEKGDGYLKFQLHLKGEVANVTITDMGDSYHTTCQLLTEEEAKGVRLLEVPELGGIGIAGHENAPEQVNYKVHEISTKAGEKTYRKGDIQRVFGVSIQEMTTELFGDYVEALQGLYQLAEQEGYGDDVFFMTDNETRIYGENMCEFTLYLSYDYRARVTITKEEDRYITTFRMLHEGEMETEVKAG